MQVFKAFLRILRKKLLLTQILEPNKGGNPWKV